MDGRHEALCIECNLYLLAPLGSTVLFNGQQYTTIEMD